MSWRSYRDLIVWQKAMELVDEVYRLSKELPSEELYALSAQMRRAAVSIPSNIAEGYGRRSVKEFRQFLSVARGSVFALETQIEIAVRQDFLPAERVGLVFQQCQNIGKMLTKLSQSESQQL